MLKMNAGQHPARRLSKESDKTEMPVEIGSMGRFGVHDQCGDRQRFAGPHDAFTSIGQQDGAQAMSLESLVDH
jgi:hypothetical protein